ncbi:MAG: WG repeat-containing protein [Oscillospiraceae bacterium]|nr:WG repeat-containing protein [Oscillospiraceae bacterium]
MQNLHQEIKGKGKMQTLMAKKKALSIILAAAITFAAIPGAVISAITEAIFFTIVEPSIVADNVYAHSNLRTVSRTHDDSGQKEIKVWNSELGEEIEPDGFYDAGITPYANKVGEKWGFFNSNGETLIPAVYDEVSHFAEDLAPVSVDGKWGFINVFGETVHPFEYDNAQSFSGGTAWVQIGHEWAQINRKGDVLFSIECDEVSTVSYWVNSETHVFLRVRVGTNWGLLNRSGDVILPIEYDTIDTWLLSGNSNGLIRVGKDGKLGCINVSGQIVIPVEFNSIFAMAVSVPGAASRPGDEPTSPPPPPPPPPPALVRVSKDAHWGLYNALGTLLIPIEYDSIDTTWGGGFCRIQKDGKWGFFDTESGELAIPVEFDNASTFNNNFAVASKNGEWGFIDASGAFVRTISRTSYDSIQWSVHLGLVSVGKGSKWGYINTDGEVVIPLEYDSVLWHMGGIQNEMFIRAQKDGKYGIINMNNTVVVPFLYDTIDAANFYGPSSDPEPPIEGWIRVGIGDKRGIVDINGTIIVPVEYDMVDTWFNSDLLWVRNDGKVGYVNRSGIVAVPAIYDEATIFSVDGETLIRVRNDGKHGVINSSGEIIVPIQYDVINTWASAGLFQVRNDDKWGFINASGTVVVPVIYDDIASFAGGFTRAKLDGKWGILDTEGTVLVPFEYDEISAFSAKFAQVRIEDKWGVVGMEDNEIAVPIEYDSVGIYSRDLFRVRLDDKWGFYNKKGEVAIPVEQEAAVHVGNLGRADFFWIRQGGLWGIVADEEPCYCNRADCDVCSDDRQWFALGSIRGSNGGTAIDIFDALEILKYIVGMDSVITNSPHWEASMRAAIISEAGGISGRPTIFCVLEILKYIVGMNSRVDGVHLGGTPPTNSYIGSPVFTDSVLGAVHGVDNVSPPAAGGVPRGGVTLAIIPTIAAFALSATLGTFKKRK